MDNCKNLNKIDHKKMYQYIFNYFSNRILSGQLKINDKIPPEREIAEELGVSRNSIREVMHMLEMNGIVECRQGSGNYIRCEPVPYMTSFINMVMTLQNIDYADAYYLRMGYETVALRLAIHEASEKEIAAMRKTLLEMDELDDPAESSKKDIEFHNQLIAASHNRLIVLYSSMLSDLMNQFIHDFRIKIMEEPERAEALKHSHWSIYNALVSKDFVAGSAALKEHFDVVGEQVDVMGQIFKKSET